MVHAGSSLTPIFASGTSKTRNAIESKKLCATAGNNTCMSQSCKQILLSLLTLFTTFKRTQMICCLHFSPIYQKSFCWRARLSCSRRYRRARRRATAQTVVMTTPISSRCCRVVTVISEQHLTAINRSHPSSLVCNTAFCCVYWWNYVLTMVLVALYLVFIFEFTNCNVNCICFQVTFLITSQQLMHNYPSQQITWVSNLCCMFAKVTQLIALHTYTHVCMWPA